MDLLSVLASGKHVVSLVSGLGGVIERHRVGQVLEGLNGVFFVSRNMRSILERLAAGEKIQPDELERAFESFYRKDANVRQHVTIIEDYAERTGAMRLSIKDRELLREVAWNKISLRNELLEAYHTGKFVSGSRFVKDVYARVIVLNEALLELEIRLKA